MRDLSWRDAIIRVLADNPEPMHYTAIAEAIAEQELRSEFGATPAGTVVSVLSVSLQNDGEASPFVRVGRGTYALRSTMVGPQGTDVSTPVEETAQSGLINAFGMYWSRNNVLWTSSPKLLGQQQPGSTPVDFSPQHGVYLLHDRRAVIYVGRTTDQPLGRRLRQHTVDRLNGRWDRFSWFGVYGVSEEGTLNMASVGTFDPERLVVTMEALLIQSLEPPQNRKRGDDFQAVEFLQTEDPEIQKSHILNLMDELKSRL